MKLLIVHMNQEEHLDEVLAGFVEIGITGATVMDSVGMGQVLAREVPIFTGFQSLLSGARPYNKTIFSVIQDEKVERALELIEEVCGSFDTPGGGIAYVLPVDQAHGLKPEID